MALSLILVETTSQIDVNLFKTDAGKIIQTLCDNLPQGAKKAEAYEFGYKILPTVAAGFGAGQVPVETMIIRFEYYAGGPTSVEFADLDAFKAWIAVPSNLSNAYPALSVN